MVVWLRHITPHVREVAQKLRVRARTKAAQALSRVELPATGWPLGPGCWAGVARA